LSQYVDNNNYFRYNEVQIKDSKFNLFENAKQFWYIDLKISPVWYGGEYFRTERVVVGAGPETKFVHS
jgi:hypothetical protein